MTAFSASSSTGSASSAQRPTVGVLGIGIMGSAISANLVKAGFPVVGYDPLPAARAALQAAGATAVSVPEEAIAAARFLILCLPNDAALCDVSRQIAAAGAEGLRVAETSTLAIPVKQQAADLLAARGITLLDCPLSGTGAQAVNRDLAVYASGDAAAIEAMQDVFDGFARVTYNIGAFGNGMRMKLMANLLVAIHNISAAEALLMGHRLGIDLDLAVKVLSDGAGGSRMLQVRGPAMSAGTWDEATMKVSTWQKDMKLIGAALADANVPAPLFSACIPVYNAAMGMGHGESDTAAVYDVLEKMSAISR
ncbi:NAD(P)-dependent oxidoreductase [Bordetella genomosp. 11]|uniref:NAD(P)-dependent oxidoreductase n=1 Tax=Bordetella genomosp. 11 TaxID=1416808 RepID=UPI0015951956|nr:NAD(P)-dependent oxidoreductase [Bordetella genomosp. 11]